MLVTSHNWNDTVYENDMHFTVSLHALLARNQVDKARLFLPFVDNDENW